MTIDDLVRDTVHGLADEADPATDLATGAMVRGRRLRHRRRAGLAAAAVALVGAAVLPYQWVQGQRVGPRGEATAGSQHWWDRPVALPGDWVATSLNADAAPAATRPGAGDLLVLDRRTGRYRWLESVDTAWPAPAGDLVAIESSDSRHVGELGIRDMADGTTRWLFKGEFNLDPQWSADGRRLLLSTQTGFTVIDTDTGSSTAHPVDQKRYACTDFCLYTWQPDGLHVALPLDDPLAQPAEGAPDLPARKGVQLFAADTGRATALLPLHGNPVSSQAWSPDGRLVLLGAAEPGDPQIADVASGQVIRTLRGAPDQQYFVDSNRLLGIHEGSAELTAVDTGKVLGRTTLPDGVEGRAMTVARGGA